jgi:cytochrome c oxidase subunit 2
MYQTLPLLIAFLLSVPAIAGDAAAGKTLYASCQTCHGPKGDGNVSMNAPALTALDGVYLKRQLQHFKTGIRGSDPRDGNGARMRAMAATLADEVAIDNVVAYIESLPDVKPTATIKGDPAKGRDYYSMVCGSCHGPKAEGNAALNAPALAGTDDWYLLQQFESFRAGIRGSHAEDKFGAQMKMMTRALPTEQVVRDVVTYIHTLAP